MEKKEKQKKFQENFISKAIFETLKFSPIYEENTKREIQIYLIGVFLYQIFNSPVICDKLYSLTKLSTAKEVLSHQLLADLMESNTKSVQGSRKPKTTKETVYFKNLHTFLSHPKFKLREFFSMTNEVLSKSLKEIQNKLNVDLYRTLLTVVFTEPILSKKTNIFYLGLLKQLICLNEKNSENGLEELKVVRIDRPEQTYFQLIYYKYEKEFK